MSETARIAEQLERTWEGDAWHGPSLKELTDGLTAKQAAARLPEGTQLIGPFTCGLDPVKSQCIVPLPTVTATSMRMRLSSSMPSLSR